MVVSSHFGTKSRPNAEILWYQYRSKSHKNKKKAKTNKIENEHFNKTRHYKY